MRARNRRVRSVASVIAPRVASSAPTPSPKLRIRASPPPRHPHISSTPASSLNNFLHLAHNTELPFPINSFHSLRARPSAVRMRTLDVVQGPPCLLRAAALPDTPDRPCRTTDALLSFPATIPLRIQNAALIRPPCSAKVTAWQSTMQSMSVRLSYWPSRAADASLDCIAMP